MSNVRRIDGPKPLRPSPMVGETGRSNPTDDPSRRVAVLLSLAPLMDELANEPVVDSERLALLVSRVGEIADAYRFGHSNITDAFQRLAAAAAWCVEGDVRRAAR